MKNGTTRSGFLWGALHCATELICFYSLYAFYAPKESFLIAALAYDALAFLPQIFFGALCDKFPRLKPAALGFGMLALSLLFPAGVFPFLLLTLGNALIHVEGAERTLRGAKGKMTPSGLFVGGGSFGVIAGRLLAPCGIGQITAILLALAGFLLTLLLKTREDGENSPLCGFSYDDPSLPLSAFLLLCTATVAVRAYAAYSVPTEWLTETWEIALQFVVMGLGKALGGVAADRIGARKTSAYSLLLSIPLLCLGNCFMIVSLIGIFLYSMTMTVSLALLVSRLDRNPGAAFGITTIGLFLGVAPAFFFRPSSLAAQAITLTVLTLAAAACFLLLCGKDTHAPHHTNPNNVNTEDTQ